MGGAPVSGHREIEIVEIDAARRRDRSAFVALPFALARNHTGWHPGLRRHAAEIIDPGRNPFWKGRPASFFLARRDGVVVGRMALLGPGTLPDEPETAVLAFPDFVDDEDVAAALFEAVGILALERGATRLVGPMNPDIHHDVGIQIEGHHLRNTFLMGYQPPYYRRHFEGHGGFEPLADFQAWALDRDSFLRDGRLRRIVDRVERRGSLHLRAVDLSCFDEELRLFHRLYSEAFRDHWGFVAPTWEEFRFLGADLKYVLRRGAALVAEWEGEPSGFVLGVPDLHGVFPDDTGGRLTPSFLLRALLAWRGVDEVRVMIAGVLPGFRKHGIHAPLFYRVATRIFDLGFRGGEISWVMVDNGPMARTLPLLGASVVKTYRLYQKVLHQ